MIKRTFRFSSPCYLSLENEQLIASYNRIKGQEELPDRKAAVEDIGIVLLEHHQITITHALMGRLLENNAALITCNDTHHPAGLLLNLDGHTNQSERFRAQQEASVPLRKQLWQQCCIIMNLQQRFIFLEHLFSCQWILISPFTIEFMWCKIHTRNPVSASKRQICL